MINKHVTKLFLQGQAGSDYLHVCQGDDISDWMSGQGYFRATEVVEVEFTLRPQEETVPERIAAIDKKIADERKALNEKLMELNQQKAELLAISFTPEPEYEPNCGRPFTCEEMEQMTVVPIYKPSDWPESPFGNPSCGEPLDVGTVSEYKSVDSMHLNTLNIISPMYNTKVGIIKVEEPEPVLQFFYATLSDNHEFNGNSGPGYVRIRAQTEIHARRLVHDATNGKWAFMYDDLNKIHVLERECLGNLTQTEF
jgi:hypothetical protein